MDKDEGEALKNSVHHPLERHAGILKAKEHPRKFPKAERNYHLRFADVSWMYWNLVQ